MENVSANRQLQGTGSIGIVSSQRAVLAARQGRTNDPSASHISSLNTTQEPTSICAYVSHLFSLFIDFLKQLCCFTSAETEQPGINEGNQEIPQPSLALAGVPIASRRNSTYNTNPRFAAFEHVRDLHWELNKVVDLFQKVKQPSDEPQQRFKEAWRAFVQNVKQSYQDIWTPRMKSLFNPNKEDPHLDLEHSFNKPALRNVFVKKLNGLSEEVYNLFDQRIADCMRQNDFQANIKICTLYQKFQMPTRDTIEQKRGRLILEIGLYIESLRP